ncbi:MAG: hypothetical protein B6242_17035 [Anaerolineaceae bacterium 4572_78]|nr:MAG: hypothetical protein B6242_17035 [Anaerolineaceae bacterium 4572_78]
MEKRIVLMFLISIFVFAIRFHNVAHAEGGDTSPALFTISDEYPTDKPEPQSEVPVPTSMPIASQQPEVAIASSAMRPQLTQAYIDTIASHEIQHGDGNYRGIALTFDCGANVRSLNSILATLATHSAKGTFFLEGNFVAYHPEIVPSILQGGNEIGNHSYGHPYFTRLTQAQVATELAKTELVISVAAGRLMPMRYFRFPYGARNATTRRLIAEQGYQSIFWGIDPQGWRKGVNANSVIANVTSKAYPGAIVLMHCANVADENALPVVIDYLHGQEYVLGTLSEIINPLYVAPQAHRPITYLPHVS